MPPPFCEAEFPLNVQLITVGWLSREVSIPPPELAVLFVNMQLVTVGVLPALAIPPPDTATFQENVELALGRTRRGK